LKVLHFVDENALTWSRPWIQLLSYLQTSGLENAVVCRPGGDLGRRIEEHSIPVHYYCPPVSNIPSLSQGLAKIFKDWDPDIIHTRLSSAALQGGYWGKKHGYPVISTVDKYAKIKYYERADMVICVSSHLKKWLEICGLPASRMEIIPNSLCIDEYTPDLAVRKRIRCEHGVADNEKIIMGAGRFVGWKGFDILLDAFSSLHEDNVKLWFAGRGPEEDKLRNKVEALNLQEKVTFWGFVKDIRPLLWASDLFVLPSREPEPFGLILLEAMASGLPVIATGAGGPMDMVTEENGWLVKLGDRVSMCSAMQEALSSGNLSMKGAWSTKNAENFDVSIVGERHIRFYEKVLNSKSK